MQSLKGLQKLDLKKNKIVDLSPLSGLTELNLLMLDNNGIQDLTVLVAMAKKDDAGDKRFAPFWRIYISGNPLTASAKSEQIGALKKHGARLTFKEAAEL